MSFFVLSSIQTDLNVDKALSKQNLTFDQLCFFVTLTAIEFGIHLDKNRSENLTTKGEWKKEKTS